MKDIHNPLHQNFIANSFPPRRHLNCEKYREVSGVCKSQEYVANFLVATTGDKFVDLARAVLRANRK